ncbi:hypothetical protein PVK64_09450 [Aliivibrio sp. S4TY2]|nr:MULTISPECIES: hypothetical protein [unclassified Aliivibrio]MDD9156412.1 hypothetical protein [Aliivibrio sp. S4TY2]MDD9162342.1 hypothetical protein [Aliivibrio sp. S4TY1]MDD9167907.1 hypothetical protein [Aliivibrio sp. S4MY4]MDD9187428.1 hypothetical protein [Aliivibrio sp. S4MY3]MDD9202214.1 hypothetical protein [Aliivibrio sp. S4MY1]
MVRSEVPALNEREFTKYIRFVNRNRTKEKGELHHTFPSALSRTSKRYDDKTDFVFDIDADSFDLKNLSYQNHLIAHEMLAHSTGHKSMWSAFWLMLNQNKSIYETNGIEVCADLYATAKANFSEIVSGQNRRAVQNGTHHLLTEPWNNPSTLKSKNGRLMWMLMEQLHQLWILNKQPKRVKFNYVVYTVFGFKVRTDALVDVFENRYEEMLAKYCDWKSNWTHSEIETYQKYQNIELKSNVYEKLFQPPWNTLARKNPNSMELWHQLPTMHELWQSSGRPTYRKFNRIVLQSIGIEARTDSMIKWFNKPDEELSTLFEHYELWKQNNFQSPHKHPNPLINISNH